LLLVQPFNGLLALVAELALEPEIALLFHLQQTPLTSYDIAELAIPLLAFLQRLPLMLLR